MPWTLRNGADSKYADRIYRVNRRTTRMRGHGPPTSADRPMFQTASCSGERETGQDRLAVPMLHRMTTDSLCAHLVALTTVRHAQRRECAECVKIGARWVHLRTCQQCGRTLCCDASSNRHATKHAQASGHPVIASDEPNERWLYCYPDDLVAEY